MQVRSRDGEAAARSRSIRCVDDRTGKAAHTVRATRAAGRRAPAEALEVADGCAPKRGGDGKAPGRSGRRVAGCGAGPDAQTPARSRAAARVQAQGGGWAGGKAEARRAKPSSKESGRDVKRGARREQDGERRTGAALPALGMGVGPIGGPVSMNGREGGWGAADERCLPRSDRGGLRGGGCGGATPRRPMGAGQVRAGRARVWGDRGRGGAMDQGGGRGNRTPQGGPPTGLRKRKPEGTSPEPRRARRQGGMRDREATRPRTTQTSSRRRSRTGVSEGRRRTERARGRIGAFGWSTDGSDKAEAWAARRGGGRGGVRRETAVAAPTGCDRGSRPKASRRLAGSPLGRWVGSAGRIGRETRVRPEGRGARDANHLGPICATRRPNPRSWRPDARGARTF